MNLRNSNLTLVGEPNETNALIEGIPCRCLVDSGAQVTTIADKFYQEHLAEKVQLNPLDGILNLWGAGGHSLGYKGCVILEIGYPDFVHDCMKEQLSLALVVPDTDYNLKVPLTIGTNLIRPNYQQLVEEKGKDISSWPVSTEWKIAYRL